MTADEAAKRATARLVSSDNPRVRDTPALDVSVLLARFLGMSRAALIAHPETLLPRDVEATFERAIDRRMTGTPVAYLVGEKEFWDFTFLVTEAVLIPKPDTETLVERTIELARKLRLVSPGKRLRVLDVCTGSGCVAIILKREIPEADVWATDISSEALAVARANASRANAPVTFVEGDLRDALPLPKDGPFDIVVSNPPYVPSSVTDELLRDGRGEPRLALDGGTDGLDLVRALAQNVRKVLRRGGLLIVETGEYNAREAASVFANEAFSHVAIKKDLSGLDRVVEGWLE